MYTTREASTIVRTGSVVLASILLFAGLSTAALLLHAEGGAGGALFDAYLFRVARFTLLQAGLSTILSVALAIPVARALARRPNFPARNWIVRLSALPLGLPALVATLGIVEVWGRRGVVNQALAALGLDNPVSVYGLAGILIAHVFFNLPLAARLLMAGLERIPAEYWLTSANLGMGSGATFRLIEWPVMRGLLPGIAGLVFMLCATSFTIVLTLGGGPAATTIEVAIYQALRFDFDPPRAVILSVLQILLTGTLLYLLRLLGTPAEEAPTAGRAVRRFDGKRGRLSDGLVIAAFTLFTAAPLLAVVTAGLASDLLRLASDPLLHRALVTSLAIALASATLCLAVAMPAVAIAPLAADSAPAALKYLSGSLQATSSLILLVPPVVVATGWFLMLRSFGEVGRFAPYVVIVINALMALPFVMRVLQPAYRTHIARTGRLAVSLGVTGLHRLRWIDLPALKRPLLTAFAFAMALSLGDLGAVAIFGADGLVTLPWLLFSRMGSYRTADAAGIALLLGVICLLLTLPSTASGRTAKNDA
ncbi:thiamine/thiamine pyrophosphate ABC transporter permease [Rhizobium sp. TRM96647]|uniref:thiamine/thiamine pyrophosphate ABC transporter permease n=1 Tax=unclassified Rhizobium TaxID=2613769 RepID=UPI0021E951A7|nr:MULTISPECIES: thiamine/thiamine pyrophosphate ABC transporter permease [unclassified Rhizobium]MCV3734740.1 thiamine/thiamine pyrophosphate ABC transporter permease [Rhizobium sp. TRM96647]MCV3757110.1 thiamine/thiamine pyrophosphate ABC transporter permease [Rhizobium sp. TRM96650]